MMQNSVIYARVSSVTDRQNTERQVMDLQQYALKNGINVVQTFEERVSGAKKNKERPILQSCLDYCVENDVRLILCSEVSRLGRNIYELIDNIRFCNNHKICVFFQKESLFTLNNDMEENPYTAMLVTVLGIAAQLERENVSFRLNSGRAAYIEKYGHEGLGRPKGTGKTKEQLFNEYKHVIKELKRGTSIRRTAKLCDVSTYTVQRVKKEFEL